MLCYQIALRYIMGKFYGNLLLWDLPKIRNWRRLHIFFYETLYSTLAQTSMENKMLWRLSKNGCFCIWPFYDILRGVVFLDFPWKVVWRVKVRIRETFFELFSIWGKILTNLEDVWRWQSGESCIKIVKKLWILCFFIV